MPALSLSHVDMMAMAMKLKPHHPAIRIAFPRKAPN
jgi:hypothetical protein